jgi:hypothetical protein
LYDAFAQIQNGVGDPAKDATGCLVENEVKGGLVRQRWYGTVLDNLKTIRMGVPIQVLTQPTYDATKVWPPAEK